VHQFVNLKGKGFYIDHKKELAKKRRGQARQGRADLKRRAESPSHGITTGRGKRWCANERATRGKRGKEFWGGDYGRKKEKTLPSNSGEKGNRTFSLAQLQSAGEPFKGSFWRNVAQ